MSTIPADSDDTIILDAAQNAVKSVTIFQSSSAEVTRAFTIVLKSGPNVVQIYNISNNVDADSPRIHNLGNDAHVSQICCNTRVAMSPKYKRHKHRKALNDLKVRREKYEARKTARESETKVLNEVARSYSDNNKTSHFGDFMDSFRKRKDALVDEILECAEEIALCDELMWNLNNEHKGDTNTSVVATIVAKKECKVDLRLTYLVSGVSWEPCYDLRASTSQGKTSPAVSLSYCANIMQSTGEDWENTTLVLSTAKSQAFDTLSVPKVDALSVKVTSPAQKTLGPPLHGTADAAPRGSFSHTQDTARCGSFGHSQEPTPRGSFGHNQDGLAPRFFVNSGITSPRASFGSGPRFAASIRGAEPTPSGPSAARIIASARRQLLDTVSESALTENDEEDGVEGGNAGGCENDENGNGNGNGSGGRPGAAGGDRGALSLAYRIERPATVPSDGVVHRIVIADIELGAELRHVCVPRRTTTVLIEGTVRNTSEYELLAGPVRVLLDDAFVTKTSLDYTNVNESFDCVLGVDSALKVSFQTRTRTTRDPLRSFAESVRTTVRTATIAVANGHTYDIAGLVVRDAIPVGDEDSHVKVTLRRPEGLAQARDGDEVPVSVGEDGEDARARWTKGEKEGMYEWVCGIPAGKRVELQTEWEIKALGNVRWEETSQKPAFQWK